MHDLSNRMRCTPTVFQNEKEAHLEQMLAAGVIQPSSSAWVSALVKVRKKDGSVRRCVEYVHSIKL